MRFTLAVWMLVAGVSAGPAELPVAPKVDLSRYAGTWHEIARLPNRFQRQCVGDTTATYSLRPDGRIVVVNQCRKEDGRTSRAEGTAWVADKNGPNTKLKVRFFWPFSGDYWILHLDPQYRWVVVGEPSRKYLWILSRTAKMADPLYQELLEKVKAQGFDTSRVVRARP